MNVSQVNSSEISNSFETRLALGSGYADVSLIKVQPPSEYRGLGNTLSPFRNEEAETGQSHVTASHLGVLFEGLVPQTPYLIRAYGLRCSEVAKNRAVNPPGTREYGVFASQVGADGTNIWAAATSGQSAIAVHLLACILARVWDSPKAISIWMELIAVRKEYLASSGRPLDLPLSRIRVDREQIARWDASARAWLLTADQANENRQKQLRLIIDHLGIPVNAKLALSESVIDAWTNAMVTVDKLIAGVPHSVQIGASLLGLTAWHLYPDMIILGKDIAAKEVKQSDRLINPGGILTIGIEDTRNRGEGIYWSLPLAYMRYYGDPIICKTTLHSQASRVSIDQLVFVALGCLIRRWCAAVDDIDPAAEVLVDLYRSIYHVEPKKTTKATSWLELFGQTAKEYITSKGSRKNELLQLIKYGRRRFASFVDNPGSISLFGLSDPSIFFSILNGNIARVSMLQMVARDFSDSNELMVIQCKSSDQYSSWEMFSVCPLLDPKSEVLGDYEAKQPTVWISKPELNHMSKEMQQKAHKERFSVERLKGTRLITLERPIPLLWSPQGYQWQNAPPEFYLCYRGIEPCRPTSRASGANVQARFLFGDSSTAALYSIKITWWTKSPNEDAQVLENKNIRQLPNIFILRHIKFALELNLPDTAYLYTHLASGKFSEKDDATKSDRQTAEENDQAVWKSLQGLVTVWNLYQNLNNATVELKVASSPLCFHQWIPEECKVESLALGSNQWISQYKGPNRISPFSMDQKQTFACIARFESGTFNFTPSAMSGVIAISSNNSLYVTRRLLQDPWQSSCTTVDRVIGNVGKSGMAFLVSPEIPRPPRAVSDDYALVNHYPFSSKEEDCFQRTTLHMNLTGWELPIDVGSRGNRDIEAYYAEVAIGIYDHGKWVADVNIMNIFQHRLSIIVPHCSTRHERLVQKEDLSRFVSIDSWEELLDNPLEIGVVRAHRNWQARLAAAALSLQQGHETRILPEKVCWDCCNAITPVSRAELKESIDQEPDHSMEEIITGASEAYNGDDNSDSDMDGQVAKTLRPSKRQKPNGLDVMKVSAILTDEEPSATPAFHHNIIYIL
jgi:hypothetical protein